LSETKATLTARDGSTYSAEQAADGTWTIHDYPVFADGVWKGEEYSAARVDALVTDTNAALPFVSPALGIGHPPDGQNTTAMPAFGRFGALARAGKFIVSELQRIPAKVFDAIRDGLYGPVSVETRLFRNPLTKKTGEIVYAVRFLGMVPPEVVTLAPATEFAADEVPKAHAWEDWKPFSSDTAPTTEAAGKGDPNLVATDEGASQHMSDEMKAREDALALERADFEKAQADLVAERKQFEEGRRTAFAAEVVQKFDNLVMTNHCKPADKETWTKACEAIGPSNPIAFSAIYDAWANRAEVVPNKGKAAGTTEDESEKRADVRLFAAVQKVMKDRGITDYGDAAAIVERENPELLDANRKLFACDRASGSPNARRFSAMRE
jgi:hypothetical protein